MLTDTARGQEAKPTLKETTLSWHSVLRIAVGVFLGIMASSACNALFSAMAAA